MSRLRVELAWTAREVWATPWFRWSVMVFLMIDLPSAHQLEES